MTMFLRVMVIFSNQCLGPHCSPYMVFFRIQNASDWINGQPIRGLMMSVSF